MKIFDGICLLFLVAAISACSSLPKNTSGKDVLKKSSEYYEDNGGKGIKLAILEPEYKDVNSDDSWLPIFIQGTLANNINIFSEITVLDRQNIEKIIAEQKLSLSGNFSDADYIRIGHLTNAQYVLSGTLINIGAVEIALQLSITNTETGERKASFVKNCTVEDIKSATIINEATTQLLSQIGVKLTEKGEKTLLAIKISTNKAETALSKGIAAQKKGTIIDAMSYYYDATFYNPALTEAANRLSSISTNVKTGNIGADARNAIEEREAWSSILAQCGDYYKNHLPIEIKYNPNLIQTNLNYERKTVDLHFSVSSYQSPNIEIIQNILTGLKKTKKKEAWGWANWPTTYAPYVDTIYGEKNTKIIFALVNDKNKKLSTAEIDFTNRVYFTRTVSWPMLITGAVLGAGAPGLLYWGFGANNTTNINFIGLLFGFPLAIASLVVVPLSFVARSNIYKIEIKPSEGIASFKNVNAYDITDKLTIKIVSINGIDADEAIQNGYVNIVKENK